MERLRQTCGSCSGLGYITIWKNVLYDTETQTGTADRVVVKCDGCDGNGYTEYAVFSIEEAEAILKHCGLEE